MTLHDRQTSALVQALQEGPAANIAVARGDGIGPEIMDACLRILAAAGARLAVTEVAVGLAAYQKGHSAGIAPDGWNAIRSAAAFYKAPLTTPQGGGMKSFNVTARKALGLYANVRPVRSFAPFVPGPAKLDMVIVRENEEDLYAGIEHRQTDEVVQCLKLMTRSGCERIARYAFEYARAQGRRKVTCLTKDNIMKLTDGLFREVFEAVGAEYPEIAREHMIIDIGAARIASRPEHFDVVLAPNLYGDIVSDIAAEVAGSVGLAGSANVGPHTAMFEAVHGSAPDIAGTDIANPSGLLAAGVLMLAHVGQGAAAALVQNAWLRTIEDGVHTADMAGEQTVRRVGCRAFADAVIARLGEEPRVLPRAALARPVTLAAPVKRPAAAKSFHGIDIFLHAEGVAADALAHQVGRHLRGTGFRLAMITNRGVKVWPEGLPETTCSDHWRCRVLAQPGVTMSETAGLQLALRLAQAGLPAIKTENLYAFDGVPGYSLGQGQ